MDADKKTLDELVVRIKAEAAEDAKEDRSAGIEAGKEWAVKSCTAKEFRRLSQNTLRLPMLHDMDEDNAAGFCYDIICGGNPEDMPEFWKSVTGARRGGWCGKMQTRGSRGTSGPMKSSRTKTYWRC